MTSNTMRVTIILLVAAIYSPPVAAQHEESAAADPELAEVRAMIRAGREDIIRGELRLTESEAAAFWPVYEDYRKDSDAVLDRYADLIAGYAARYHAARLTDDYADDLVDDYLDIESDLLRVRKNYLKKFRRVLPSLKVARFYQLENKINAEIDAQLALAVPLVDPG